MTVRAKFSCGAKIPTSDGGTVVHMNAVYSSDPKSENKAFHDATPSGYFQIVIAKDKPAADAFKVGKEYYFDISEAP